ncbi:MAG: hypothetical protein KBA33_02405 [Cloacibacterium sp.]|jgi:hypothetical protein|nr:hypothetical protein [Cloacibacterium sp.]
MKKILFFFLLSSSILSLAQSKYTVEQVEKTNDIRVIANFIKNNPDHPKTPAFKQKLANIVTRESQATTSKSTANKAVAERKTPATKSTPSVARSKAVSGDHQKTAETLNHLFNENPNKSEAYIKFRNNSKCAIVIKITGKKSYSLNVPANAENYILVTKGLYHISSMVCGASFAKKKNVTGDFVMFLGSK